MNKQFFFHGNPSNGETTAKDVFNGLEEKIYADFFTNNPTNGISPCLVCEIRKWKNTYYSIYSYYCKGRDVSNRPNGHCVLSLIVEGQYCRQVYELYNLMKLVYEIGLKQNLKYIDTSGRYLISSFYGKEQLDILQNDFYSRLDENAFYEIDSTFQKIQSRSNITSYSTKDVDSASFFDCLREEGKIFVSELIKSNKEELLSLHTGTANLVASLEDKTQRIKELESNIAKIKQSPMQNPHQQGGNEKLIAELQFVKGELSHVQNENKRLKDLLNNTKQPFKNPQETLIEQVIAGLQKWFPIIVIGLLFINIYGTFSRELDTNPTESLTISTLNDKLQVAQHYRDSLADVNAVYKMFLNATIDITGINANTISKDKSYEWKIIGAGKEFDETNGELFINKISIYGPYTPTKKGEEQWVYYYNNIPVKSRDITVK